MIFWGEFVVVNLEYSKQNFFDGTEDNVKHLVTGCINTSDKNI